ncbi:hypothetical protein BDY19DRAFT_876769, partial [Irpex rosettiformis]
DVTSQTSCKYFIGKHSAASRSSTGRGTKGYVTFNFRNKLAPKLSFIKDYWRPNIWGTRTELANYLLLNGLSVCNIATAIGGGDVPGQLTISQNFLGIDKPAELSHCRIVFEELARPLSDYKSSALMILAVYNALEAHYDGWRKARILHRDISVSNIMRVVDQSLENDDFVVHGILNDWDLSKHKNELKDSHRVVRPVGTWAFMSAVSLQYPLKPSDLADDLE